MSMKNEPVAMDIDSDYSASDQSDSSQISYIDDYENLPSTGRAMHAHVVDLGEYKEHGKEKAMLKLQDAIVTTLYNISPDVLKSFLSPTVNTFKAVFGKKDVQLVIWRKGVEVLVGTFENHTSMKSFRFEHLGGFLIGYDGSWHLKITASNAYSASKWPEVWSGKFEDRGGVLRMTVEVEESALMKRASLLAEFMLTTKYWELKTDIKTT
ncbi:hypothetical protein DE146DRAFT_717593 [Phaeosphaeria sp. MPI-PUGE-AT-0046c]|nr:hypothetical protein DE146DRAFT_717593 [Phaeosphaeria sp. MPI-PUGE-AT-0046c]